MTLSPSDLREVMAGLNMVAVILAGYYAELVRLGIPTETATALTVAAQNSLWPKPKATDPDA